jgi:hypothetical protein
MIGRQIIHNCLLSDKIVTTTMSSNFEPPEWAMDPVHDAFNWASPIRLDRVR